MNADFLFNQTSITIFIVLTSIPFVWRSLGQRNSMKEALWGMILIPLWALVGWSHAHSLGIGLAGPGILIAEVILLLAGIYGKKVAM